MDMPVAADQDTSTHQADVLRSQGAGRAMRNLSRADVLAALDTVERGAPGAFADSTKYDIEHKGHRYPPKRVVGIALEKLTGRRYQPRDFRGGDLTSCFRTLQSLGFKIVDKAGKELPVASPGRVFKYGKPSWQLVLDAVRSLGGSATKAEISAAVISVAPGFRIKNIDPDLRLLTVNSFGRGNFGPNEIPRRTDEGNPYDALFKQGTGRDTTYVLYDPSVHGIWELTRLSENQKLRPRLVLDNRVFAEFEEERARAESNGMFDPADETDARRRTFAAIVRRQGQGRFRDELLRAYGGRCAISDCDVEDALEAAHICSYMGPHTNAVVNGILMRADIHTLFDLGLLGIDPIEKTVYLAEPLRGSSYQAFNGKRLRLPPAKSDWPNNEALMKRAQLWAGRRGRG